MNVYYIVVMAQLLLSLPRSAAESLQYSAAQSTMQCSRVSSEVKQAMQYSRVSSEVQLSQQCSVAESL